MDVLLDAEARCSTLLKDRWSTGMQKHKNGVTGSYTVLQHVFMQMKNCSCDFRMEELWGVERVYKQAADILLHSSDGDLFSYDVLIRLGLL